MPPPGEAIRRPSPGQAGGPPGSDHGLFMAGSVHRAVAEAPHGLRMCSESGDWPQAYSRTRDMTIHRFGGPRRNPVPQTLNRSDWCGFQTRPGVLHEELSSSRLLSGLRETSALDVGGVDAETHRIERQSALGEPRPAEFFSHCVFGRRKTGTATGTYSRRANGLNQIVVGPPSSRPEPCPFLCSAVRYSNIDDTLEFSCNGICQGSQKDGAHDCSMILLISHQRTRKIRIAAKQDRIWPFPGGLAGMRIARRTLTSSFTRQRRPTIGSRGITPRVRS